MFAYGRDGRCLMVSLLEQLDDPNPEPCGRCSVCAGPTFDGEPDATLITAAPQKLLRSRPIPLTVRKQTPKTADRPSKRIPPELQLEEGRALTRTGEGGWSPLVDEGRTHGPLRRRARRGLRGARRAVGDHARAGSRACPRGAPTSTTSRAGSPSALGVEHVQALERTGDNPPQREMENSSQQVANVRGQFRVRAVPKGPGLLVDDVRYSGWTLATVGAQLRQVGAGPIYPLVLQLAGA